MKQFSLLIKPSSADCNLRCEYCFYLDRSQLYPESKVHRMSDKVLEKMIYSYMATNQAQYAFGWQGGEPTLMGVDFFKRVTELQQKYGKRGVQVSNGLQTNGTLITDELAKHLAQYNFLVGVSVDGPAHIHDHYRKNQGGKDSHAEVMAGIKHLSDNKVDFNILTLVNAHNAGKAGEVYNYLKENRWHFHQYIPCVEFDKKGNMLPFAVSGDQWGEFMCGIFDQWQKADTRRVSVRLFDSILAYLVDGQRIICHMGRNCRQYFVVEHNGDVYPCDFFVYDDLKLGNVLDDPWEKLDRNVKYKEFGLKKAEWNEKCGECEFLDICSADCLKHRFIQNRNPQMLSWLCQGWKQFYKHTMPTFRNLADDIREERLSGAMPPPVSPAQVKVGRNDPCPCGSGKKYKKCCLLKAS